MDAAWWRASGRAWWIAVPLGLSTIVTFPITRAFFFGDDLLNLYLIANHSLGQTLLAPYGGHELFVRNGLMAIQYALFGSAPAPYFCTAVLTHLGNVVLLAVLIRDLTDSERLACFGAAFWGTSPVMEGTLGWYAVYGHALATTGLLIVLVRLVRAGRSGTVSALELATWALLLWAASTSFGVGLAFVLVLPIMAWLLLPPAPVRARIVIALSIVAVLVVAFYVGAQHVAATLYGVEPQTPALLATLSKAAAIVDITANQLAFGTDEFLLGPVARFVVVTYTGAAAVAVPVAVLVAVAMWKATAASRRAMLAFLLLAAATYGIIAAGRAGFYAEYKHLLVRSDRYHYAAPLALGVVVCLALAQVPATSRRPWLRTAALAACIAALALGLATVRPPVNTHRYARDLTNAALASIHALIRAEPPGQDVYIANQLFLGVGPMVAHVPRNFPGWAALFVVYHRSNVVDGRRVFFVEPEDDVRDSAADGLRSATLLVDPDDVPADRIRHPPEHPRTGASR